MSYRTRECIRWFVALVACLWATYEACTLGDTILLTWFAAEMLSPDEHHFRNFKPYLLAVQLGQECTKRVCRVGSALIAKP